MEKTIGGNIEVVVDINPKDAYSRNHPIRLELGGKGPNLSMTLEEVEYLKEELTRAEHIYKELEKRVDILDEMDALSCDVSHAVEAMGKAEYDSSQWVGACTDLQTSLDELKERLETLQES
jgi:chromosome segregation ATPase